MAPALTVEPIQKVGAPVSSIPCHVPAFLELTENFQELHEIQIVYLSCLRVVPESDVFTGDRHKVGYAQGRSSEYVCLQGQAVSVPATDLENGFKTLCIQKGTASQGACFHHCVGHFGNHKGIEAAFDLVGIFCEAREIIALGWVEFPKTTNFREAIFSFNVMVWPSGLMG